MFDKVLQQIKEKINDRQYVMTLHAEEEMEVDGLTIIDVEFVIACSQILERQRDEATARARKSNRIAIN